MGPADYAGIVTCIGALTGGITSIVIAVRQHEVKRTLETVNSAIETPVDRTIGEVVTDIADTVHHDGP